MTNLKTVNYISQDKFSELIETPNDEIYFVDAENFGMPDRDNAATISSGYIAEKAGIVNVYWHSTSTAVNTVTLKINDKTYKLSNYGSGYYNNFEVSVSKGDVITWSVSTAAVDSVYFYPLKGY